MELADTSAWWVRRRDAGLAREFEEAVLDGRIATSEPVEFELLFSARDEDEVREVRSGLALLPHIRITAQAWQRAFDVMEAFAKRAPLHHRQLKLPDVLIAAAAESAGVPLLHYDQHFELIAGLTGQPQRAIAPLGSL